MYSKNNLVFATCIACLVTLPFSSNLFAQTGSDSKTQAGYLGVMHTLTDDNDSIITNVAKGSPADGTLYANDILLAMDGQRFDKSTSLNELASKKKPGDKVTLKINRLGKTQTVNLTLAAKPQATGKQAASSFQQLTFASEDGLTVTADLYKNVAAEGAPFIVLCHQAGWSRGEYREIAPKLNALGFNCLAIDQRSGNAVGVKNMTVQAAKKAGKATEFVDAEQDIVAALKWAKQRNPDSKIILWGSSYSSALSLRIAGEHPELLDGVLAFAPGEYFARLGKPKDWIARSAKNITVPAFITSAKAEARNWKSIFDAIPGNSKVKFLPRTTGNHGSRALWERFSDHADYWTSVKEFLSQF